MKFATQTSCSCHQVAHLYSRPPISAGISHSSSDTVSCMMNGASAVRKPTQQQVINRRPPTKEECISWVKAAWAAVSKETVIRSFKCAGLTTAVDGREDMLIS